MTKGPSCQPRKGQTVRNEYQSPESAPLVESNHERPQQVVSRQLESRHLGSGARQEPSLDIRRLGKLARVDPLGCLHFDQMSVLDTQPIIQILIGTRFTMLA